MTVREGGRHECGGGEERRERGWGEKAAGGLSCKTMRWGGGRRMCARKEREEGRQWKGGAINRKQKDPLSLSLSLSLCLLLSLHPTFNHVGNVIAADKGARGNVRYIKKTAVFCKVNGSPDVNRAVSDDGEVDGGRVAERQGEL